MNLVKHYLESIAGIEIYPIISFTIFFILFAVVTWYVIRLDKRTVDEMASLVFDTDDDEHNKEED